MLLDVAGSRMLECACQAMHLTLAKSGGTLTCVRWVPTLPAGTWHAVPESVLAGSMASPPDTYRNAWHCFRSILKYEGVRGLYRGVSAPLIGGALETGMLPFALECIPPFVLL